MRVVYDVKKEQSGLELDRTDLVVVLGVMAVCGVCGGVDCWEIIFLLMYHQTVPSSKIVMQNCHSMKCAEL